MNCYSNQPLAKSRPSIFLIIILGVFYIAGVYMLILILYGGIEQILEIKSIDSIAIASFIISMLFSLFPYYIGRQLPLVRVYSDRIERIYPLLFGYRRTCRFDALDYKSTVVLRHKRTDNYLWLVRNGKVKVSLDLDNQIKPSAIVDAIPLPYVQVRNPDIISFGFYLSGLAKAESACR